MGHYGPDTQTSLEGQLLGWCWFLWAWRMSSRVPAPRPLKKGYQLATADISKGCQEANLTSVGKLQAGFSGCYWMELLLLWDEGALLGPQSKNRNEGKEGRPLSRCRPCSLQSCNGQRQAKETASKAKSALQSQACWHHQVVKRKVGWRLKDSDFTGTSVYRRGNLKYFILLYCYLYPI